MSVPASSVRSNVSVGLKRRRRWPRYATAALVTAILLVYFAPSVVLRSPLRDWLLRRLSPEANTELQVGGVSGGWRTPIELRGVRYSSPSMEFLAESVRCDRTLLELLRDSQNLGCIRVVAPQLSVSPRAEPSATVEGSHAVASRVDAGNAHRQQATAATVRPAISGEIHVTEGSVYIGNSRNGRTCLARGVSLDLNATPNSDQVTFRLMARTGDPKATAHVSARGTLRWPCDSSAAELLESHVELVGVEAELAENLLAAAGLTGAVAERLDRKDGPRFSGTLSGTADFRAVEENSIEARVNFEIQNFGITAPAHALELREPTISISAVARLGGDRVQLDAGRISMNGLIVDAAGEVRDCAREARAELRGSILCDWQKLAPRLGQCFSEEIQIAGRERRPWRLSGPLRGNSWTELPRRLQCDVGLYVESLRIYNFELGPTELAAHCDDGVVRFEPIECAFQRGQIRVQPSIRFSQGTPVLHVSEARVIDQVALDPKLCDWILRYVDPLATISRNLQGHLSLDLDALEIPLTRDGLSHASVLGRLELEDVQLSPEESLREILATAGIAFPGKSVRTSQKIEIRMSEGRVHHAGLALPIGNEQVTLDGWVGLDQAINIRVSLPVTEEMLGKDKRLYRLLRGQRIELPVTGTLEDPKVTEEALARNIQRLIQSALRDNLGDDPLRGLLRRALK